MLMFYAIRCASCDLQPIRPHLRSRPHCSLRQQACTPGPAWPIDITSMFAFPMASLASATAAPVAIVPSANAGDLFLSHARSVATGTDLPTATTIRTRGQTALVADRFNCYGSWLSRSFTARDSGAELEHLFGGAGLPEVQLLLARSDWGVSLDDPKHLRPQAQSIWVLCATPSACLTVHGHKTVAAHVEKDSKWHLHASDAGGFTYRVQLNPAANIALAYTPLDPDSCGIVQQYLGESVAAMISRSRVLLPFRCDRPSGRGSEIMYECVVADEQLRRIGWSHHSLYDELRARCIADIRLKLRLQWMNDNGRMRDVHDAELYTSVRAFKCTGFPGTMGVSFFPIGDVQVEVRPLGSDQCYKLPFVYANGSMRVLPPSLAVTPLPCAPGPFAVHLSFALQLDGDGLVSLVRIVASQSALAELDDRARTVYSRLNGS